jgi:hypothetical protein
VSEVVTALAGIEAIQQLAESTFESFDGSLGGGPQERLEFGERQFDWVEVGTIRRQIDELGADAFDRFADAGDFVSGQIVHHDEVALMERRRQLLLNVAEEHVAVHRTVDHGGRCEAAQPQRADEGRRFPVAVGDSVDDALAAKGPAVHPSELGMGPAFVEKRQSPHVEMRLPEPPSLTEVGDVWTQLLSRMNNFF